MPQDNFFDQFDGQAQPVPVQSLRPIIGAVSPEEQARKAADEARAAAAASRAEEEAARKAVAFDQDQSDRALRGGAPTTESEKTAAFLATRVANGIRDLNSIGGGKSPEVVPSLVGGVFGGTAQNLITSEDRQRVEAAQRDILDAALTLGTGAAYTAEQLEGYRVSYFPRLGDSEVTIADKQTRLKTLLEAAKVKAGAAAPAIDEALATVGTPQSPLAPTGEQQQTISGTNETFLTPEDQQLQARLNSAYKAGASLQELQAISAEFGRSFPVTSQQELDAGRKEGRAVNVLPTGRRSEVGKLIGGAADSPVGGAIIGAANALTSGGLDELAGVLGADAATVQAAKEALRERYPVSSFVGEVAGQAGQLAVGGAGLRAVGAGAKALAGAEIAQGAAYGAGESNDNRLGGAAIGAGGAFVGQQLAQRLLNPAAKQVIERIAGETGAPVEVVEQAVAEAFEGAARQAPSPAPVIDELTTPPLTQGAQEELGTLAQQALQRGKTGRDAQAKLAIMAQVDPEAKAAADNLGIELPVDVLSNDARLLTVTGLARSQKASEAEGAWGQTVAQAVQKSDDTLRAVGATNDLAQVSDDIRERLLKDMGDLEAQATTLRTEVTDAINVQDRVDAQSLQAQLAQTINDLGGIDEAKQAFSAEEKKLLAMLGEGDAANRPTYARLNQIRDQIGRALFKGQGPWVDAPTATLKRYYGALADDQIAYVESVGGKELADKMRGSNDLYSQMFKARESMQTVYGKSLERDIGPLINRAITSGSKGDAQALRKLVAAVPSDMQSRALVSGILSQVDRGSAQGGFSFAKYANIYQGLRKNSPVYAEIAKTVGPEAERILRDLYSVSKRVAIAESKIVRTGASNQPLLAALNAEGLVGKLAGATARVGTKVAGATAGGVAGGPAGAFIGQEIAGGIEAALTSGGKSRLDKLHNVIVSEPFKDLVEKVGNGTVKPADISKAANEKSLRRFAATVLGVKTFEGRKNWLQAAITAGATTQTRPEEQATSIIEVR